MTARSNRTLVIVLALCLFVSICLNMFVAGAVITGRWLEHRISSSIERVMQTFPPEIRRDVMRRLIADRKELMTKVKELRDSRQRMVAVMRADPFDSELLATSMADVRDKTTALQALLQSALAASLAEMPASEREKIKQPGYGIDILDEGKQSSP